MKITMATAKQIAANRANAKKSTGPKTAEGKANLRFNNLRHGMHTDALILPSEDRKDYEHLLHALQKEWQPHTPTAHLLVEQMAKSQWKLLRVDRAQKALLTKDPDGLENLPALDRLYRQEARLERSFHQAYKELDRLKRDPIKPTEAPGIHPPTPNPQPLAPFPRNQNPGPRTQDRSPNPSP